jgi:hypothetical protein
MSRGEKSGIWVGLAILAAIVVLGLLSHGCGNAYLTAYRGIATARATAASTEQALADACQVKRVGCLETHGPGTPAYGACIEPCRKGLDAWVRYTRPAINSALVASVGSVSTAEAIKGKVSLLEVLRPVACAVSRTMVQWVHLLPTSSRATVEAIARVAAGYVCKEVP